ncbi:hypothetical protein FOPE_07143 [Fonsecaea pedrosoi]|nr:hypothetical protein FOPE_07143 [Fonsecaea pedrosoi]
MGGDDLESSASPGSGEDHELLGCDGSSPESDEQLSLPKWVHTEVRPVDMIKIGNVLIAAVAGRPRQALLRAAVSSY